LDLNSFVDIPQPGLPLLTRDGVQPDRHGDWAKNDGERWPPPCEGWRRDLLKLILEISDIVRIPERGQITDGIGAGHFVAFHLFLQRSKRCFSRLVIGRAVTGYPRRSENAITTQSKCRPPRVWPRI